jgi:two-component system, response regulator, stage 0 sporulation protein A
MGELVDLVEYKKRKDLLTVLIVDDDKLLVSLLDEYLKSEFPEMARRLAYNGAEALDQIKQKKPSLLIIGMYMPGLTGAEVLKKLKFRGVDIPALMISGNVNSKEEVIKLSGYPGHRLAFLRKPFQLEIFADTIRGLVSPWK